MKVVLADAGLSAHRAVLEAGLPPGTTTSWHGRVVEADLVADLPDAEVLVCSRFTPAMAAAAPGLRLLQAAGAGTDAYSWNDVPAGTTVANVFGHGGSIAEHVVATLVAVRRELLVQDRELRTGRWHSPAHLDLPQRPTLRGAVVTFLGFGEIGQATWNLLRAFGCAGIAVTRSGSVDAAAHGLRRAAAVAGLRAALAESDVLVVSIPLSASTTGSVGAEELRALGPRGYLVNVARGPVVAERPLFEALRDGTIAGAALDVWYRYPAGDGRALPSAEAFASLPNVVMTPHTSGVTSETFRNRARAVAANIARLAAGEPLENVVRAGAR
ncbi:2-hydroxyacid dehydrogenase [Kineococcus sp. SYSU DK003]|uniref:2-hydroxyacid dehydrogenase n=1 Tax=Kineococcus sp. SYSU DK003 TaxID=3383124 RepID=UPI003D7DF5C7